MRGMRALSFTTFKVDVVGLIVVLIPVNNHYSYLLCSGMFLSVVFTSVETDKSSKKPFRNR